MAYDVVAARAERQAKRDTEPFTFILDGREWTMTHPGDVPIVANTWTEAQWTEHFADFIVPQYDDTGEDGTSEPVPFPIEQLTREDVVQIMRGWNGSTPGE